MDDARETEFGELRDAGAPTRSGSVARTLLMSALVGLAIMGLSFQLSIGETAFSRPGELALVFIDIGTVLWFAATAVVLRALRWQTIDARFRWVLLAAVVSVGVSILVRTVLLGDPLLVAVLSPVAAGLVLVAFAAVSFTRARVRRIAHGTLEGIGLVGGALGSGLVAAGLVLGALRLQVEAELSAGALGASTSLPLLPMLAATVLVVAALLLALLDRARRR